MTRRLLVLGDTLAVGGTEGQLVETAIGLAERGDWNVTVACLRAEGALRGRLEAARLRPWTCGVAVRGPVGLAMAVARLAAELRRRRVSLVHAFDYYTNVRAVLAARLARVPAIASQRELGDLRTAAQRRLARIALRLADHVVVNAEAVRDGLVTHGHVAVDRVSVIPNGVDTTRFTPASTSGLPDRVVIGTLGNLRAEKGIADAVAAMALIQARVPAARLEVWGEGASAEAIKAKIAELDLTRIVHLGGATTTPETVLRRLNIFVLPSLSEACSNALLEAMATGLPVVATAVGGTPAVLGEDPVGLLVPPADPAALAKAVLQLVDDPDEARRLGAAARRRVERHFAVRPMVERMASLYERVVAQRGS